MTTTEFSGASRLVRVTEVARHLSLSRSKIYQLMHRGDLPYVKLGKSRRVPLEAAERLVSQHMVDAVAE